MKTTAIFVSLGLLLLLFACEQQEDEAFVIKKMELREKIDETIVSIDEEIQSIQRDILEKAEEGKKENLLNQKEKLMALRDSLRTRSEAVQELKKKQWESFKTNSDSLVADVKTRLVTFKTTWNEMRPPYPY